MADLTNPSDNVAYPHVMSTGQLLRACILVVGFSYAAAADSHAADRPSPAVLEAACARAQSNVNTLADFTSTQCWATAENSFLFISEKAVFLAPSAKKAWLLTVVAAIGKQLNDLQVNSKEIVVSDVANTKNRIAWSLPGETAKTLQQRVSRGDITVDRMYQEILAGLKPVAIHDRH